MLVRHLASVSGELVLDLDPAIAPSSAGGVRIADGLTLDHVKALARTATYRAATFEERIGGAAVGIRPRLIDTPEQTVERLRAELADVPECQGYTAEPDVGTTAEHLDAVPADPARGVAVAAGAWLRTLEGKTVAVEGFGPRSESVARAVVERGGILAGLSTTSGAVADAAGLDVQAMIEARGEHGDAFVTTLGLEVRRPDELLGLAVDALVTTGGVGSLDTDVASRVQARVVVPATAAPYTEAGIDALRRRRVVPLPDFVTTAGPFLEAHAPGGLPDDERRGRADRLIAERIDGARLAKVDPFRYAATLADTFLATWVPEEHRPGGAFVHE